MTKILQDLDASHKIYQYKSGFSFGTDAVLLSGFIKTRPHWVGVEFGTGSGIIPLLLSMHRKFKKIYAVEIQKDYVLLSRENLEMNGFSDKVEVIEGNLKDAKELICEKVDFVFSNPPYMKRETGALNESDRKTIARHEVFCDIEDVCRAAGELLQDKGQFFCVWRIERMCDLMEAMRKNKIEPKDLIFVSAKKELSPKLLLVRGVKGARPGLKTRTTFVLQDEAGERSEEAKILYEEGVISYGGKE